MQHHFQHGKIERLLSTGNSWLCMNRTFPLLFPENQCDVLFFLVLQFSFQAKPTTMKKTTRNGWTKRCAGVGKARTTATPVFHHVIVSVIIIHSLFLGRRKLAPLLTITSTSSWGQTNTGKRETHQLGTASFHPELSADTKNEASLYGYALVWREGKSHLAKPTPQRTRKGPLETSGKSRTCLKTRPHFFSTHRERFFLLLLHVSHC